MSPVIIITEIATQEGCITAVYQLLCHQVLPVPDMKVLHLCHLSYLHPIYQHRLPSIPYQGGNTTSFLPNNTPSVLGARQVPGRTTRMSEGGYMYISSQPS